MPSRRRLARKLGLGVLAEVGRLAVLTGRTPPGLRLISAGEHHYELAGLTPDPGDDAFLAQRDAAVQALGPDQAEATLSAGRGLTMNDAIALAREQLIGSRNRCVIVDEPSLGSAPT